MSDAAHTVVFTVGARPEAVMSLTVDVFLSPFRFDHCSCTPLLLLLISGLKGSATSSRETANFPNKGRLYSKPSVAFAEHIIRV